MYNIHVIKSLGSITKVLFTYDTIQIRKTQVVFSDRTTISVKSSSTRSSECEIYDRQTEHKIYVPASPTTVWYTFQQGAIEVANFPEKLPTYIMTRQFKSANNNEALRFVYIDNDEVDTEDCI